jgi:tRNA1(Val) A37 N6-methylase TrmN6
MKKETLDLITNLKDNNQDHEWYSTTTEIIKVVYNDLIKSDNLNSILDIGAGNGKVFDVLKELNDENKKIIESLDYKIKRVVECYSPKKYAIEKSKILINAMSKDIFIVGTDFHQQSLIDKKVDVIFCNPPYSEYESWTEKILKEANSDMVYLVIPKRWQENKTLQTIIKT